MPDRNDHLDLARENERFGATLLTEVRFLGWAVTGYFYAAIHYVEAYLSRANVHSGDHRTRDSHILQDTVLRVIYDEFSDLKNDSTEARYQCRTFTPTEINTHVVTAFTRIKAHLTPRIQ